MSPGTMGSQEKVTFATAPSGFTWVTLTLRDILIRFAQLADIPSLTLVTHGEEKFIGGTDDAVLSAHRNISTFGLGDENRIALHKLTDHRVEVVIRSSHNEQVTGHGRIGNKPGAIRL